MPHPETQLEQIHRANRDSNLERARECKDRGRFPQVKWHVRRAREWNKELIRLKKDSG